MVESLISNRLIFSSKRSQRAYLRKCQKLSGLSWRAFAKSISVSERTVHDWAKGKYKMSYEASQFLTARTGVKLPPDVEIVPWNEHLKRIAHLGGRSTVKLYKRVGTSESYRKKKWYEWWESKGKYHNSLRLSKFPIRLPKKNETLAEFIGIMLGDGGVAPYHISITLNSKNEIAYKDYVVSLLRNLFDLEPKVYKRKDTNAFAIIVQRKALVEYCERLGLKQGNKIKQGSDIPVWITNSRLLSLACIRGLFDTDGSFFFHQYNSKGKSYKYLKVSFSNRSGSLINSVKKTLINLGINVRIAGRGSEVRLESQDSVKDYIRLVGTHNPKHKNKIDKWKSAGAVNGTVC